MTIFGIVSVFTRQNVLLSDEWDVLAKRANFDGSLGGTNAAIEEVTITVSGEDIILSWPLQAPNAEYYIYKSAAPYTVSLTPDTTISDTIFIYVDAVLDEMKFYDIRWEPLE